MKTSESVYEENTRKAQEAKLAKKRAKEAKKLLKANKFEEEK